MENYYVGNRVQHPWGAYHCSNESGLEEILLSSDSHPTEAPYAPHLTVKTQSKTKYVKSKSSLTKDPQSLDFISFFFIFFSIIHPNVLNIL